MEWYSQGPHELTPQESTISVTTTWAESMGLLILLTQQLSLFQTTEKYICFKNQTTKETQKATQHKHTKIQTLPD